MCKRLGMLLSVMLLLLALTGCAGQQKSRRISADDYVDKMKAGWIGQMAGVGWGFPTEFKFNSVIVPEDKVPEWKPEMINQYKQDDLYVEMTFLRTLEVYGMDVSILQAGKDFADSKYSLFHANWHGRDNLRKGIAPPDSGHPEFNKHADDIDYQIEADFSGLISPGMPNAVIGLGEKFGRLMNYGDGVYAGQFVGGMYAEAFFETDIDKIIQAGLKCIPEKSLYHGCITDVVKWHKQNPNDWQKTWGLINEKYDKNPEYVRFPCGWTKKGPFNIDVKLNGAYIVMGLLYGNSDIEKTIVISMRCGQDSDCNPSNAAGILFTTMGYAKVPERFKSALDTKPKFDYTEYDFPGLISVCTKLAEKTVIRAGGKIEMNSNGGNIYVIPVTAAKPGKLQQSFNPGPIAGSRYDNKKTKTE
jgi:hypothetical protein